MEGFQMFENLTFNLLFFLKLFLMFLIFGYAVFTFVIVTQVIVMNRLFRHNVVSELVFATALFHLFAAGFLFFVTLVIL